jgi:hypothetical protein
MRVKEMAIMAVLAVCVVPCCAQQAGGSGTSQDPAKETRDLKEKAAVVTKAVSAIVSSGNLPQDSQTNQTLQNLIDQLKSLNDRLTHLEDEVSDMKGKGKVVQPPVTSPLGKTTLGGFVQLQYRSSENKGEFDGFGARRVRLNVLNDNDRTHLKVSFDFATTQFGSTINEAPNAVGQLRDAYVAYDTEPGISKAIFGQQNVPLGYEIERSDTDREMPERTKYNDTFFNGQRAVGVQFRRNFTPNVVGFVGGMNALTFTDPGQRAVANSGPVGNRLAVVGGVRFQSKKADLGVSALAGKRQSVYGTPTTLVNPTNDRRCFYVDGRYMFTPKLTLRAEAMVGHARIPNQSFTAGDNARDVNGGHVQVAYAFNPANELAVRYEQFDPNTSKSGDLFHGISGALLHMINPNLQLSAAFERFTDQSRATDKSYNVTTLRVQYKF